MEQAAPRLRLSANAIKLLAVLCMTVDHIAWSFVPTESAQGQIMHFFGRVTAPVMCFFLTEGYHHTKSKARYLMRMALFAVISHFPFTYFECGRFWAFGTENVIATLTIALICVHIVHVKCFPLSLKISLIMLLCIPAERCDWGGRAVLFALCFALSRPYGLKKQCLAYGAAAALYVLDRMLFNLQSIGGLLYLLGVFLPIPLLLCYSGERGKGGKLTGQFFKWFFYLYYPAHLLLLGFLKHR